MQRCKCIAVSTGVQCRNPRAEHSKKCVLHLKSGCKKTKPRKTLVEIRKVSKKTDDPQCEAHTIAIAKFLEEHAKDHAARAIPDIVHYFLPTGVKANYGGQSLSTCAAFFMKYLANCEAYTAMMIRLHNSSLPMSKLVPKEKHSTLQLYFNMLIDQDLPVNISLILWKIATDANVKLDRYNTSERMSIINTMQELGGTTEIFGGGGSGTSTSSGSTSSGITSSSASSSSSGTGGSSGTSSITSSGSIIVKTEQKNSKNSHRILSTEIKKLYDTYRSKNLYNRLNGYIAGIKIIEQYDNRTAEENDILQTRRDDLAEWREEHKNKIEHEIKEITEKERDIRNGNGDIINVPEEAFIDLDKENQIVVCSGIKLLSTLSPKRSGTSKTIVFLGVLNNQSVIVKIGTKETLATENELYNQVRGIALETHAVTRKLEHCDLTTKDVQTLLGSKFLNDNYKIVADWKSSRIPLQSLVIEHAKGEPLSVVFGYIHAKTENEIERREFDLSMWVQIAHALHIFEQHNFIHDDLHFNNIIVEILDHPIELGFLIRGKPFKTKYRVKIIDFDNSQKMTIKDVDWLRFLGQYETYEIGYSMPYIEKTDAHWAEMKNLVRFKQTVVDKTRQELMTPMEFLKSDFVANNMN